MSQLIIRGEPGRFLRGAPGGGAGINSNPYAVSEHIERSVGDVDPISQMQLVNAVLTGTVLNIAGRQDYGNAVDDMYPSEQVPAWNYTLPKVGGEELVHYDTRRAAMAQIASSFFTYDAQVGHLTRFTFSGLVDLDQMRFASPWDVAARAANIGRRAVELDMFMGKVAAVKQTANYGEVVTITAGNGFNLPGAAADLRTVINEVAGHMESRLAIPRDQFTLGVFGSQAKAAILEDVELLKKFVAGSNMQYPSMDWIKTYLGIGNITFANPIYRDTANGATKQIFDAGGLLTLYYNSRNLTLPTGDVTYGRTFNYGPPYGAALEPFFIRERTSWCYPWQGYQDVECLVPAAASLIIAPWQDS